MEPQLLQDAIDTLSRENESYTIRDLVERERDFDITSFLFLFSMEDNQKYRDAVMSMTRREMENFLFGIPKLIEIYGSKRIIPIFQVRYRSFMFRIVFLLWQDFYDKKAFRDLFLFVFSHPKTGEYAKEVNFTAQNLKALVKAEHIDSTFSEMARNEKRDMREFLAFHKIQRESVIAIDAMSIFFLFCSSKDYLDFGSERLIIALHRFDIPNQAKILNNMMRVMTQEERTRLTDVFLYFLCRFTGDKNDPDPEFWGYVAPEIRELLRDEMG